MSAHATVIIPTYGEAPFARWAIKSVQQQTVLELEICIICDGSSPGTVAFFRDIAKEDERIRVFAYPKSPRTGEPYRDEVISKTTGKIICYCAHDDLWLPGHVKAVEETLQNAGFTHSIHTYIHPSDVLKEEDIRQLLFDFGDMDAAERMLGKDNYFGLTFGAHTRAFYNRLDEGWVTTPDPDIPTDLFMWQKFISLDKRACKTTRKVTALGFPKPFRTDWDAQRREKEIKRYYEKLQSLDFLERLDRLVLDNYIAKAEEQRKTIYHLQENTEEKDRVLQEKNAQMTQLLSEMESQRKTIYHLQENTEEKDRALQEKNAQITHLSSEMESQQKTLCHLQEKIEKRNEAIRELQDIRQNLEDENARTMHLLNELEGRLARNAAARVVLSVGEGTFFLKIKNRMTKKFAKKR